MGFRAMQFNFVVSTNTGAVRLWQRLGFEIVGTLPGVFQHQKLGFVDAFVMFKQLIK
jgi:ribosomal protein S18 acetylase RimI-like enzyme